MRTRKKRTTATRTSSRFTGRPSRSVALVVAVALVAGASASFALARGRAGDARAARAAAIAAEGLARRTAARPTTTTTSTTAPPPPTTTAPTTTLAPPPAPAAAAPPATAAPTPRPLVAAAPLRPATAGSLQPYNGLGTWLDVYDWSHAYTKGNPPAGLADIDRMAAEGVQTLYIQASKHDAATDVLEPELLGALIARAHERGMRVVAWYLPTLVDPGRDLQRLVAIAGLDVDGIGVDIEARDVADVDHRNERLVQLSAALRQALPGRAISAIVLPPVVLEVVNRSYWPRFPWRELVPHYDVWMTMGYWTNRTASSGYRDAHRYTRENVDRLRANIGIPDAPVHPIGGIGDATTPADVDGFRRAAGEVAALGGSLYDWRTTRADAWPGMRSFRAP